jgi:hypothetical protein
MNPRYKTYLQSEHWKAFRKKVYSKRRHCQNCGITKNLNIHHKHYRTVGNESESDVIVLCNPCHFRFHSRKKWTKAKRRRQPMNFTEAQHQERPIYHMSEVLRPCPRCSDQHPCFYKRYKNGTIHLAVACPNSKPRTQNIKFEPDLPIPTIGTCN